MHRADDHCHYHWDLKGINRFRRDLDYSRCKCQSYCQYHLNLYLPTRLDYREINLHYHQHHQNLYPPIQRYLAERCPSDCSHHRYRDQSQDLAHRFQFYPNKLHQNHPMRRHDPLLQKPGKDYLSLAHQPDQIDYYPNKLRHYHPMHRYD